MGSIKDNVSASQVYSIHDDKKNEMNARDYARYKKAVDDGILIPYSSETGLRQLAKLKKAYYNIPEKALDTALTAEEWTDKDFDDVWNKTLDIARDDEYARLLMYSAIKGNKDLREDFERVAKEEDWHLPYDDDIDFEVDWDDDDAYDIHPDIFSRSHNDHETYKDIDLEDPMYKKYVKESGAFDDKKFEADEYGMQENERANWSALAGLLKNRRM